MTTDKETLQNQMRDGLARHFLKMGFTTQTKVDQLRLALLGKANYVGWGYKNNRKVQINMKMKPRSEEEVELIIARMSKVWKAFLAAQKKS